MTHTIGVLGSGSWGTALAVHLARTGHDVRLWARDAALAEQMAVTRVNAAYLPGIELPKALQLTQALDQALAGAEFVVMAVPSHGMRAVARAASPLMAPGRTLISAAKGLEEGSMLRMSELLRVECPAAAIVVLSGPSFAIELARELPTAMVAAGESSVAVESIQAHFRSNTLRLYGSGDVVGVEIGGALKNTIAIAAGVVEGLGLGHNALAALITRGLAELSRLAVGLGAQRETMAGLAGLGDLVLTATGDLSRNRQVGMGLAQGRSLPDVLHSLGHVAEGVYSARTVVQRATLLGVDMPIVSAVAAVLQGEVSPTQAVSMLMVRGAKGE